MKNEDREWQAGEEADVARDELLPDLRSQEEQEQREWEEKEKEEANRGDQTDFGLENDW